MSFWFFQKTYNTKQTNRENKLKRTDFYQSEQFNQQTEDGNALQKQVLQSRAIIITGNRMKTNASVTAEKQ